MLGIVGKFRQARSLTSSWLAALKLLIARRTGAVSSPMPGLLYNGRPLHARRSDWFSVQEVLLDEEYAVARSLLAGNDQPLVIDGGANIGAFSLYMLAKFPNALIHAYEPSEDTFAVLAANTRERGAANWQIHRAALWKECGTVQFEMREYSTSRRIGSGGSVSVPAIDLATVMAAAGTDTVDLMKIDIEGAEGEFLIGQAEQLSRVTHVLLELHPDRTELSALIALMNQLYPHAYRVSRKGSSKPVVLWTPRGDLDLPGVEAWPCR